MFAVVERTKHLLHELEGMRLRAYDDKTGLPVDPGVLVQGHVSIGYGRCLDSSGPGVSTDEMDLMLENDIIRAHTACLSLVPSFLLLAPHRQVVLLAMAFQLGRSGLGGFRKMLAAISAEDWPEAERQMLDSVAATQTPRRFERLVSIWRGEGMIP